MHVVINPELVMEVESRMGRAFVPSMKILPPHLRGSTYPHLRKNSPYPAAVGNRFVIFFCLFNYSFVYLSSAHICLEFIKVYHLFCRYK